MNVQKWLRRLIFIVTVLAAAFSIKRDVQAGTKHPTVYKGVNYSRVYNYNYFVRRYPGLARKYNNDDAVILRYFATAGMKKERRGSSAFDPKSYRYGNADLRRLYGTDYRKYYLHYIRVGYKQKARRATAVGATAMRDALTVFEGVDYGEIYDYRYFTGHYPQAVKAVGDDDAAVLAYFVRTGMKKRMAGKDPARFPKASPDSAYYRTLYRKRLYPTGKTLPKSYVTEGDPISWNETLLRVISTVKNGGGYYTGSAATAAHPVTTWAGMHNAFTMGAARPSIVLAKARPSFCSSAVYLVMMKALLNWDKKGVIPAEAWVNLKPYTLKDLDYPFEDDGFGCWGRANANGPGVAVLVKELEAGRNYYIGPRKEYKTAAAYWSAWGRAEPGDLLKIFRDKWIGTKERGHMVVYLGHRYALGEDGERDDIIYYWSSQQSTGGYGIEKCRASEIYRGVLTKITRPAAFANAKSIAPTDGNVWLASLVSGHNSTVAEMKAQIR